MVIKNSEVKARHWGSTTGIQVPEDSCDKLATFPVAQDMCSGSRILVAVGLDIYMLYFS